MSSKKPNVNVNFESDHICTALQTLSRTSYILPKLFIFLQSNNAKHIHLFPIDIILSSVSFGVLHFTPEPDCKNESLHNVVLFIFLTLFKIKQLIRLVIIVQDEWYSLVGMWDWIIQVFCRILNT